MVISTDLSGARLGESHQQHRTLPHRFALALVVVLLLGVFVPPARGAYSAILDLNPTSGLAGSTVTATGSGHTPNGIDVEIHWEAENGMLLASVDADASGEYSTTITIPAGAAPGVHTIVACETAFALCTEVDHEFAVGATTTFTVSAPPTTATTAPPTTPPPATPTPEIDVPEIDDLPSFIGVGGIGQFGPYGSAVDGFEPTLYLPRCAPPTDATILDFDTDRVAQQPDLSGHPEVSLIPRHVGLPSAGTITPRQAVFVLSGAYPRLVVVFATPQRYVGLYVGDGVASGHPIELIARNASGAVVAVDRIPQAEAAADTCMAVRVAGDPTITDVLILTDESIDVFADRLFYSSTGDMTIPPRTERGTVEFLRPLNHAELSTRVRQLVLGTIRIPAGFSIDDVTLSVPRWDRSGVDIRHIDFFPLWVDGDEQLYSFVASGVYVPQGGSYLGVTATGPGVLATGLIEVVGIGASVFELALPEGRIDIQPVTLEVTQAIRGPVNLIAPGTIISERDDTVLVQNKKTVVRAFARYTQAAGGTFSGPLPVNAELVGTRDGVALPGSPLAPVRADTVLALYTDAASAYHDAKQRTDGSWNFVLPDSWTDPGTIDLRLEVNSSLLFGHIEEAPGVDGVLNMIQLNDVTFRSKNAPTVDIWLVDYYYKCAIEDVDGDPDTVRPGSGSTPTPSSSFCVGLAEGDVTHAQPTRGRAVDAVVASWNMAPFPGGFPATFDTWEYTFATDGVTDEELEPGPLITPGSPQQRSWLGVALHMDLIVGSDGYNTLSALMTSFVRGQAWGSPSFFRVTPTPITFLHEAAHTMGVRHTGDAHRESNEISRWIDDHGQIGENREVVSAFDTSRMQALPYLGLHDLMSYGPNKWTSWDVWKHIEDAVGSGFPRPDHRNHADLSATGPRRPAGPFDGAPPEGDDDEVVTYRGRIGDDGVEIVDAFHLPGGVVVDDGELVVRALDGDGSVLSETVSTVLADGNDGEAIAFSVPVLVPAGATQILILLDGDEIDRRDVTAPPQVTFDGLPDGPLPDTFELSWSATAGAAERYLVEVTRDGDEWFPLALTTEPRADIQPAAFPFRGSTWRMRVQASSGTAISISPEVEIDFGERPTTPTIALPVDGSTVASNTFITLQAVVSRFSLGDETAFVWKVDGTRVAVGPTGLTFAGDPGTHVITLTAPATGLEASAMITVVADADLDGMSDEWEAEWGFDPQDPADADDDGDSDDVPAWQEFAFGASPQAVDTDGDDYSDGVEIAYGTDPVDPLSFPSVWDDGSPVATISGGSGTGLGGDGGLTPVTGVDGGGGAGLDTLVVILLAALGAALLATTALLVRRR